MSTAFVLVALIAAGAAATVALWWRLGAGRAVLVVLLGSFALRVGLAVALYVISAWHLPILTSLHLEDGFWRFSRDAQSYHWLGVAVADSLRWGTELPDFRYFGSAEFPLMIGFLYRFMGVHPLYVPLINAALCSIVLGLVYWLARRLNGERAGLVAVIFVAAIPSLYLWSAQLLKDVLALLLTLVLLVIMTRALEPQRLRSALLLWVAAIPVVLLLAKVRYYAVPFAVTGFAAVILLRTLALSPAQRRRMMAFGLASAAALVAALYLGRGIETAKLMSPAVGVAREGHLRKAAYLEQQGDTEGARLEYARANGHVETPLPPAAATEILTPRFPDGSETTLSALSLEEAKGPAPPRTPVRRDYRPRPKPEPRLTWRQRVERAIAWVPARIALFQSGYLMTNAGGALPDAGTTGIRPVTSNRDVVVQLPRATATALWAPFPWQWSRTDGDTGAFRRFSSLETLLFALLTPWMAMGIWRGVRSQTDAAWLLIGYAVPAAVVIGLIVLNLGSLFRLRLQFAIPLLIVAAAYSASQSKIVSRLARLAGR